MVTLTYQQVRRRTVGDLEIYFFSHDALLVKTPYGKILFHYWFSSVPGLRRAYTFKLFRKELMYHKEITLPIIYRKANKYMVNSQVTTHSIETVENAIKAGNLVELPWYGQSRNKP